MTPRTETAQRLVDEHRRKMHEGRDQLDRYLSAYICHSDQIPNQRELIAYTLEDLYALHGCSDALPETSALVRIVERAEADMRAFRNVHPHGQGHPLHPKITDYGYYALKELPEQYFSGRDGMSEASRPERIAESVEGDRLMGFGLIAIIGVYGSPLVALATLPITLPLATAYAVLPDRARTWIYQRQLGKPYEQTEGRAEFARMRPKIDEVIAHYQSTQN